MRIPRLYVPLPLASGATLALPERSAIHVGRVLRLKPGAQLVLFNGEGGEYQAVLSRVDRRAVEAQLGAFSARDIESPLRITLAQGISRGERMDYAIQKAVELGAARIAPLLTERTGVSLDPDRAAKRLAHWQGVIESACEQSGRTRIPQLLSIASLDQWLAEDSAALKLVLHPQAERGLRELDAPDGAVSLLIGPEGGLSEQEVQRARGAGYLPLRLGPRVLRTETAAVCALAALQACWGDIGRA